MTSMTYRPELRAAFSAPRADWCLAVVPTEDRTRVSSFGPAAHVKHLSAMQLTNKSIVAVPQLGSADVVRFVTDEITGGFGSNTFRALSPPA